jgi:hypothetical protein
VTGLIIGGPAAGVAVVSTWLLLRARIGAPPGWLHRGQSPSGLIDYGTRSQITRNGPERW